MTPPLMTLQEIEATLKQRFPMLMVDSVLSLEPGKSIRAVKNVTLNEPQSRAYMRAHAGIPCTLIVEAIGQAASILFAKTAGTETQAEDLLVLGSIDQMTFPAAVIPGDRMEIEVRVLKFIAGLALVEAEATVENTLVAKGKVGFARMSWQELRDQLSA